MHEKYIPWFDLSTSQCTVLVKKKTLIITIAISFRGPNNSPSSQKPVFGDFRYSSTCIVLVERHIQLWTSCLKILVNNDVLASYRLALTNSSSFTLIYSFIFGQYIISFNILEYILFIILFSKSKCFNIV